VSAPEDPAAVRRARCRRLRARAILIAAGFILLDILFGVFLLPRLLVRRSDHFGPIQLEPEREELVLVAEPKPSEPLLGRDGPADFNLDVEAPLARIDQGFAQTFRQLTNQEPPTGFGRIHYFSLPGSTESPLSCSMNFRADAVDTASSVELHLREEKREGGRDQMRVLTLTAPKTDLRVELEPVAPPEDPTSNGIGCKRLLGIGGQEWEKFRSVKIMLVVKQGSPLTLSFWRKSWESAPELLVFSELPLRSLRVPSRLELVSQTGKADLSMKGLSPAGDKLQVTVEGAVLASSGSDGTLDKRSPVFLAALVVLGLLHAWPAVWLLRAFRRPLPEAARSGSRQASGQGVDLSTVFISYSHADEAWKDRLVKHLKVLEVEGMLETWDDRRIKPGEDWFPAIEAAMEKARVAVLLVSADFLTSKFIRGTEVPRFLERRRAGLQVIPVIVHPCAWQAVAWLAQIQCRPKDGRPLSTGRKVQVEADLAALALEIRDLLHEPRVAGSGPSR